MRILCVAPYYRPAYVYGGPARSLPALCEALTGLGCQVEVFTTDANGRSRLPVVSQRPQDVAGVRVTYFPRLGGGSYFYSPALGHACRRQAAGYDLVYVLSTWAYPFLPACRAAGEAGVPYVVSPRTSFMRSAWKRIDLKKGSYHRLVERPLLAAAAAIHYTTLFEQQESAWLNLPNPWFLAPNPVELSEFQGLPVRGEFRTRQGIPAEARLVLTLSRLEPRKGLELALHAFSRLQGRAPDAWLVIAGPDKKGYRRRLQSLAGQLGIEAQVRFTGYLPPHERLAALGDADVFLHPSHAENFGMAVVEAMACKLPVVISEQVGIQHDLQAAGAGVVASLDPDSIADQLDRLLEHPALRQELGTRAARLASDLFSPPVVARQVLAEFSKLASRR